MIAKPAHGNLKIQWDSLGLYEFEFLRLFFVCYNGINTLRL